MKRLNKPFIFLCTLLLLGNLAFAEEETEKTTKSFSKQMADNFTTSVTAVASQYLQNDPDVPDASNFTLGALLNLGSDALVGHNYFNMNLYLAVSSESKALSGAISDPQNTSGDNNFVDFVTLYYQYRAEKFRFLIGKNIFGDSIAEIYTVSTWFNSYNIGIDAYPIESGVWYTQFDYILDNHDEIAFGILPFNSAPTDAPENSRWGNSSQIQALFQVPVGGFQPFLPAGAVIDTDTYNSNPENWSYYLRYGGERNDYEFFGLAYFGINPNIVLADENPADPNNGFVQFYPKGTRWVAGAARKKETWKIYTEALYQTSLHQEDQDWVQIMVGTLYQDTYFANMLRLDSITPNIEVTYEAITREQKNDGFLLFSSESTRPTKRDVLLNLELVQNEKIAYNVFLDYDYWENGRMFGAGIQYTPIKNLDTNVFYARPSGPDSSVWGRYSENDLIQASVTYSF